MVSKRRGMVASGNEVGFSLVEVMVVVALVGLIAAVGLPTMQQWLDRYKVRTAAEQLASLIQLQRMRAVSALLGRPRPKRLSMARCRHWGHAPRFPRFGGSPGRDVPDTLPRTQGRFDLV